MATADLLETLTISANGNDSSDITITALGATAAGAALTSASFTAAGGADITTATLDVAGATLTSWTMDAQTTGSSITITDVTAGSIDTMTMSAVTGATVDVSSDFDVTTIGSITMSGGGTLRMDDVSNQITTLESIDASDTSGTVVINMGVTAGAINATLGTGTNTYTGGAGDDVVTLASSGGTDTIKTSTTNGGLLSIHNWQVGASADDLELSVGGISAEMSGDIVELTDETADVANTDAVVFVTTTSTQDLDSVTGNILVINADMADADITNDLEATGTHAITTEGAFAANDGLLIMWDDGVDSYLSVVATGNTRSNTTFTAGDLTQTNLVKFVGISDVTTIVAGNFDAFVA
jgi:hypothetical protein